MVIALLAITIGAMILSGLVTIYIDVPRQMGIQFRNYGANMIFTSADGDILPEDLKFCGEFLCYVQAHQDLFPPMSLTSRYLSPS